MTGHFVFYFTRKRDGRKGKKRVLSHLEEDPSAVWSSVLLAALVLADQHHALDEEEEAEHGGHGDVGPPGLVQTQGGDDVLDGAQGEDAEEGADNLTPLFPQSQYNIV